MKVTYNGKNDQQLSEKIRITHGENNITKEEWEAIKNRPWTKKLIENGTLTFPEKTKPKTKKDVEHNG